MRDEAMWAALFGRTDAERAWADAVVRDAAERLDAAIMGNVWIIHPSAYRALMLTDALRRARGMWMRRRRHA
jgi:hypothetical protein